MSSSELKKKGIVSFRLKPDEYALIEKYVAASFHQNGNIQQPTVGALAKHFLIANSNKYMKYLESAWNAREQQKVQGQAQPNNNVL